MRLILLHVPKTAGATVRAVACRHYPSGQNIHIRPAFGRTNDTSDEREWLAQRTNRRERGRCRLVSGHFRWGIDEFLPGDSEYAVCLRPPDERVVSLYRWVSESRSALSRKWAAGGFDRFLASGLADIENGATRILAGCNDAASVPMRHEVTVDEYELAAERLADCAVVGVYDDLPGFVRRLADRYHWGDISLALPKVHVATTRRPRMSPAAIQTIEAHNRFDWMLYEQAVRSAASV